ncbi:LpqB family beta-propeller domain-containing protein [Glutamicibacter sp. MNS18]|uniref:LpqB family beta-propeller domain-containing protein n=1 Tax=Glutamicibacter sp. MNS18 TaxID=2989817 RepID=UPI002236B63A|nr:LpqB family beta-propeller domain-containing protein [Glutamicibacter sp. MNS18]MCW4464393.1 LpqB family beta-propeller domain-containing protein [Glutamicibacter sp. MNS18]
MARNLYRIIAVALTGLMVLSGCAAIPRSSPVQQIESQPIDEELDNYSFTALGPTEGASPRSIVEGFMEAGISLAQDYAVAREFMAPELKNEWKGTTRTLVYDASSIIGAESENRYTVQLEITAEVDQYGIRTEYPPHSTRAVDIELTVVDGQWRISNTPDGIMLETSYFERIFAPRSLYFYDSSYNYLVPDIRWFSSRSGAATSIVEALLAGPAPHLENAVLSAFSPASSLMRSAVPVKDGTATVDLNAETFQDSSDLAKQLMQRQLSASLDELTSVERVQMQSEESDVIIGPLATDYVEPQINPSTPDTLVGLEDDRLVYVKGRSIIPVGGVPDLSQYSPRAPAMAPVGNRFAFLSGDGTRLMGVDEHGQVTQIASGTDLLRPSMDVAGWTWTADNSESNPIIVAPADPNVSGETRPITVSWLSGESVDSLRISRDGSRALLVVHDEERTRVLVAGIVRDTDGVPRGLSEHPMEIFPSVPANTALWNSDQSIIVAQLGRNESVRAELVTFSGGSEQFSPLLGMVNLAVGVGERRPVYAGTLGELHTRVGNTWRVLEDFAADVSYPG